MSLCSLRSGMPAPAVVGARGAFLFLLMLPPSQCRRETEAKVQLTHRPMFRCWSVWCWIDEPAVGYGRLQEKVEHIHVPPPLPWLPPNWVVGGELAKTIYTTHGPVVFSHKWWHLNVDESARRPSVLSRKGWCWCSASSHNACPSSPVQSHQIAPLSELDISLLHSAASFGGTVRLVLTVEKQ